MTTAEREPLLIPLCSLRRHLTPEQLDQVLTVIEDGLPVYGAELEGEPERVPAVEAHELDAALRAHGFAAELLAEARALVAELFGAGAGTPAASRRVRGSFLALRQRVRAAAGPGQTLGL